MSACLTLLDRALILAQHELDAMRSGDVENAEQHYDERIGLMDQAYVSSDEQDPDDFRVKLIALQGYQQLIMEEGQALLESIRQQLTQSRVGIHRAKTYTRASILH